MKYSEEGQMNKFIGSSVGTTVRNIVDCPFSYEEVQKKAHRKKRFGEKAPRWKGGRRKMGDGYIGIYIPTHPFANPKGYVMEHRLVMEKHLGRYLKPEECVHHIDWDKTNNHIDNLRLFSTQGEHKKYHLMLRRFVMEEIRGDMYAET